MYDLSSATRTLVTFAVFYFFEYIKSGLPALVPTTNSVVLRCSGRPTAIFTNGRFSRSSYPEPDGSSNFAASNDCHSTCHVLPMCQWPGSTTGRRLCYGTKSGQIFPQHTVCCCVFPNEWCSSLRTHTLVFFRTTYATTAVNVTPCPECGCHS